MLRPWDLEISINRHCERAVYIQIAEAIIAAIKTGKLRAGDPLPGSRKLAAKLEVNRNTIIESLESLLAEGWLVSKDRKGTFVADNNILQKEKIGPAKKSNSIDFNKASIIFDDGFPDTKIAPINELASAYKEIFSRKGRWQLMGYSSADGDEHFREAIVQMLNYKRAMGLSPENLFITRGSQMAMYLTAQCLLSKGDYVIIENPGYKRAWQTFENAGAKLLPVAVDKDGIRIDEIKKHLIRNKKIKAVYVTPHHQFPTTVTLSMQRRTELVALSNQYGFTIIEDDYDNEFHFGKEVILPLSSMEPLQHYVYIGTMSKIIAPALRIGYLASSAAFIEKASQLRQLIDVQGDNIMAQAILQLIKDGHIKRHIKRASEHYKNKKDIVAGILKKHLDSKINFAEPQGGLAFWLQPHKEINYDKFTLSLKKAGVQLMHPQQFSFKENINGLRLGYGSLPVNQIEEGIKIIAKFLS